VVVGNVTVLALPFGAQPPKIRDVNQAPRPNKTRELPLAFIFSSHKGGTHTPQSQSGFRCRAVSGLEWRKVHNF
jgi:hypothetical protein